MSESAQWWWEIALQLGVALGTLGTAVVAGYFHPRQVRRSLPSDLIRSDVVGLRATIQETLRRYEGVEARDDSCPVGQEAHAKLLTDLKECREWIYEPLWRKARTAVEEIQVLSEALIARLEDVAALDACVHGDELPESLCELYAQVTRLLRMLS